MEELSKINLDDNVWNCDTLAEIIRKLSEIGTTIVHGSTNTAENIFGIKCVSTHTEIAGTCSKYFPTQIQKADYTLLNSFLKNIEKIFEQQQKLSTQLSVSQDQKLEQIIDKALYKIENIFKTENKSESVVDFVKIENAISNKWVELQTNFFQSFLQRLEILIKSENSTVNQYTNSNQSYVALVVGIYITALILLAGLIVSLVAKFKASKIVKYKTEECNPLNNI